MKFNELNLKKPLLEGLSFMGFEKATEIQELAIPEILHGKDLIACAQTGTGKTAAFILPILNNMIDGEHKGTNTLITCLTD